MFVMSLVYICKSFVVLETLCIATYFGANDRYRPTTGVVGNFSKSLYLKDLVTELGSVTHVTEGTADIGKAFLSMSCRFGLGLQP